MSSLSPLSVALDVARAGGEELVRHFGLGLGDVSFKSSVSDFVSAADHASEAAIDAGLLRLVPGDGAVGEEGLSRESSSGVYWVVDPLDGTTNYVYGRRDFCVSVAALSAGSLEDARLLRGDLLAGVVFAPLRGELYCTAAGGLATCNGEVLVPSGCSEMKSAVVSTGFSYDAEVRKGEAARVVRVMEEVGDLRRVGSAALDLCDVAAGHVDAFYQDALGPWDVAAGVLIARQAGVSAVMEASHSSGMVDVAAVAPGLASGFEELLSTSRACSDGYSN